jgi:hypothetical protein
MLALIEPPAIERKAQGLEHIDRQRALARTR